MGLLPRIVLGWQPPDDLVHEATEAARAADVAIVVVNMASSEGMDRASLDLPGDQNALVTAVAAANRQTVVVLNTPGAVTMPWLDEVAAVLQVWYPGEQFGPALASMLFGDASPGGRLPLTFPRSVQDLPGGERRPGESPAAIELIEGTRIGYRAAGVIDHGPLFPFGFGLGYGRTRHEIRAVRAAQDIEIDLTVHNTGTLATAHVVQAYVHPLVEPSQRYLCGVHRAVVPPESSVDVTLRVEVRGLDEVAPPGLRRLLLATSASDPGSTVLEPTAAAPVTASTSHSPNTHEEWAHDQVR
jgi:beta-glucosidase